MTCCACSLEQMLQDGTLQACALKRLNFSTPAQQAAAKRETAALHAVRGAPHLPQLLHAGCYQDLVAKQCNWALITRYESVFCCPTSNP